MIRVYQVNEDLFFLCAGQLMARLPSGAVFVTSGKSNEIQETLGRLGARYIGDIDGPFNPSDFDTLSRIVREIGSGPGESLH